MPDTPDNNELEQELRDYARRRREDAGTPSMHPATRQMLQAEVKREFGGSNAAAGGGQPAGWLRLWPRLAFAAGVIVVVGAAVILIIPPGGKTKSELNLAKAEIPQNPVAIPDRELAAIPVPASAPPPTTVTPPAIPAIETFSKAGPLKAANIPVTPTADATAGDKLAEVSAAQEPARSFSAGMGGRGGGGGARSTPNLKVAESTATFAAPPDAAGAAASFPNAMSQTPEAAPTTRLKSGGAFGGGAAGQDYQGFATAAKAMDSNVTLLKDGTANFPVANIRQNAGQRYRNVVTIQNRRTEAALPVLDEFTVSQDGDALTIVDRDGSVYSGFARLAEVNRDNNNNENNGVIQLVPNAGNGGRSQQTFDRQNSYNNSYNGDTRAAAQIFQLDQNIGLTNALVQNITANYFFRVEGTNSSLNQRVVVIGNILRNGAVFNNYDATMSNTLNGGQMQNSMQVQNQSVGQGFNSIGGQNGNFNNGLNNTFNATVPNNYNLLNGRVQLNNKQAGELNALPVDR